MLTLLVGLVLVRVFVTGELRRIAASGAPVAEQLARMRATHSVPRSLGLVVGVLCAGEVLLEAPFLRDQWGLAGALVAFLFRLGATAVWLDALIVRMDRLTGATTPYGAAMARVLRQLLLTLLPVYAATGVVLQLAQQGRLTGVQLMVLYVAFVVATVVVSPLLHRLATASREPTPQEAALIQRLSASHGLGVDRVRVELGGRGGSVVGVGRGARIYLGDHVLAGPDDELAAVLAHEAAHRDRHHITWRYAVTTISTILMVLVAFVLPAEVDRGGDVLVVVLLLACLVPLARHLGLVILRVQQEHNADTWAAARVGAEPMGRFLLRHDDRIPLGGRGTWRFHVLSGHPTVAERLAALDVRPAAAR